MTKEPRQIMPLAGQEGQYERPSSQHFVTGWLSRCNWSCSGLVDPGFQIRQGCEDQGEVHGCEKTDPKFTDAITHAEQKIENYASERLFDRNSPTKGIIFSLSNNGEGWAEKREVYLTRPGLTHFRRFETLG